MAVEMELLDIKAGCTYNKKYAFDILGLYTNNTVSLYSVCSSTTNLFHVVELNFWCGY